MTSLVHPRRDRVLAVCLSGSAILSASLILLVVGFVFGEARGALSQQGLMAFVGSGDWHPEDGEFGLLRLSAATLATTCGALLLAAPLGVAAGLFNALIAPRAVARMHRTLVELLAGIPSVVYGLWGLVVLVPLIGAGHGSGQGLLAASIVLALMILPTVALSTEAALNAVPSEQLLGAAALGLGPLARARRVALPAARRGVLAGLVLATGRAVGETMAVLMVAGNVVAWPKGLRDPLRTMTGNIALEMGYATAEHRSVLFVVGLMLMLAVALFVVLAAMFGGGGGAGRGCSAAGGGAAGFAPALGRGGDAGRGIDAERAPAASLRGGAR